MWKPLLALGLCLSSQNVLAAGTIHVTDAKNVWCGNLAVTTKLGHRAPDGECIYEKETTPRGQDSCQFSLNSYYLEKNGGLGFDCAATHVHSNVSGADGLDEYSLLADGGGRYTGTNPSSGTIHFKKQRKR